MNSIRLIFGAAAAIALGLSVNAASAATPISWADLTAAPDGSNVSGTITAPSGTVNVQLNSDAPYEFANINNTGTNYWTGSYTYNGAYNQPATSDIVALGLANTETITFSQPVSDLFIALNSYNGASVTFSQPFSVASEGCGFWGCGTFVPNAGNTAFFGSGEAVGILEFSGPISSLTMTDTVGENWHGFTVGIADIATGTPEPSSWALLIVGLGAVGLVLRRSRKLAGLQPSDAVAG